MKQFIFSTILFPLALAQNYGPPAGSTTTAATSATSTAAAGSVPTIAVAQSGLTFSPNSVTAAQGSKVVFQFFQAGHTVTQADFNAPCVPSNATGAINSGLSSTGSGAQSFFTIDVTSTDPIWFYCAQVGHCQAGMVGVINPPASGTESIDAFASAAKAVAASNAIPSNVQGGTFGSPTSATSSPSASATPNTAGSLMNSEAMVAMGLGAFALFA